MQVPVSNTLRRRIASQNDLSVLSPPTAQGSATHRSTASAHRSNAILGSLSQGVTRDSSAVLSALGSTSAQQEESKLVKPLHPHLHSALSAFRSLEPEVYQETTRKMPWYCRPRKRASPRISILISVLHLL